MRNIKHLIFNIIYQLQFDQSYKLTSNYNISLTVFIMQVLFLNAPTQPKAVTASTNTPRMVRANAGEHHCAPSRIWTSLNTAWIVVPTDIRATPRTC